MVRIARVVVTMLESRLSGVLDKFREARAMEDAGMEYLTYRALIDAGKKLEPFPDDQKTEENLVTKCTSTVHLIGDIRNGTMHYRGDSDAAFVKGELAVLLGIFNGLPPDVIVRRDTTERFTDFFEKLRRFVSISMNRTQGFFGMYEKMREIAGRYA